MTKHKDIIEELKDTPFYCDAKAGGSEGDLVLWAEQAKQTGRAEVQKLYNDVKQANYETYTRNPNNEEWKRATDHMLYLLKKLKDKYGLKPDPIEQEWLDKED